MIILPSSGIYEMKFESKSFIFIILVVDTEFD